MVDGRRRLVSDPQLLVPIDELVGEAEARNFEQKMAALIDDYRGVRARPQLGRHYQRGTAENAHGEASVRLYRIGTNSGIRDIAWNSSSVMGSGR